MVRDGTLDAGWPARTIEVMNKADLLGGIAAVPLRPGMVAVSALTGEGLADLQAAIDARIAAGMELAEYAIPHTDGARLSWLYRTARWWNAATTRTATRVSVRLLPADRARFEHGE